MFTPLRYKFGFKTPSKNLFMARSGLSADVIREISRKKNEPKWMLDFRLKAYEIFKKKSMPAWAPKLNGIDLDAIHYYIKPLSGPATTWDQVPREIKNTFERIGVRKSEIEFSSGTGAQFESESVYHSLQKNLKKKGVIFESTDNALKNHPDLFKKYFSKVVPPVDNKFAALNSAAWSGGSFIYVPKGVHVDMPLQAYFRINKENSGQFERTLIIADEDSEVHYIEGCSAPVCLKSSLHAAVVEIIAKPGAKVRYTTIQNWSGNIYNLVTKRAFAYEDASVSWLDCNIGSKLTMKYPAIFLMGRRAKGEIQSLAFAGKDQHQDTGAKIIHAAPDTTSSVTSKSISAENGISIFRGLIKVNKTAKNTKTRTVCDALLLDKNSRSDTYPKISADEDDISVAHEATVSRISEDQLFYLKSRGLTEPQAASMIINGFAEPVIKSLPPEYAVEINRLLQLQ
ncbi:MAG: Fe-S cluster assembly protein SufB [Candidatus Peregrinibacteria bacterium]